MARLEAISEKLKVTISKPSTSDKSQVKGQRRRVWLSDEPKSSALSPTALPSSQGNVNNVNLGETILKVNPDRVYLSPLKNDRKGKNELGQVNRLAESLKKRGQIQPCVVRSSQKEGFDYELTIGERRWRAAKIASLLLDVVVRDEEKNLTFAQQIQENIQRFDPSPYALGIHCAEALEAGFVTKKELIEYLDVDEVEVSRILSFAQLPKEIVDAIETNGDIHLVSSRTAAEIRALLKKGDQYFKAILELVPRIANGKIGNNNLQKEVLKIIQGGKAEKEIDLTSEIRSASGRHLFTWRKDSNGNPSISFPKDIRKHITSEKDRIELFLRDEIEKILDEKKMGKVRNK